MTLVAWRRTMLGLAFIIVAIAIIVGPAQAQNVAVQALVDERRGDWLAYVRALWPVLLTAGGLVIAGVVLGLATRFTTKIEFAALKVKVEGVTETLTAHHARIVKVEDQCQSPPSRLELLEEVGELSERMRGVEVGLEMVQKIGNTTNNYLHMMVEKGLAK